MRKRNYVFYTNIRHGLFLLLSLALVTVFMLLEDLHSFYQEKFNRGELQKGCSLVKGEVYHVNTVKYHYMNYSFVINGKNITVFLVMVCGKKNMEDCLMRETLC